MKARRAGGTVRGADGLARSLPAAPTAVNPRRGALVYGAIHPWHCLCCGDDGADGLDLCARCAADLPWLGPACARCALPLADPGDGLCPRCRLAPPPQAAALVAFRYAFPVDRLIVGLKFAGRLERARLLGTLLARHLAPRLVGSARPDALVAAPLHPARLRSRGFNQAAELARPLAAALGLPRRDHALRRVRATAEQSALDAAARQANVRDAFAVVAPLPAHVAVLDDVVTTGATAAAMAGALRDAGVARVTLLAVARAL